VTPRSWGRFWLAQGLQVPPLAAVCLTAQAWLPASLLGSIVCCAMTDSGWRWRNRLLIVQAIAWLFAGLSLA
jgi:hypothetical protein